MQLGLHFILETFTKRNYGRGLAGQIFGGVGRQKEVKIGEISLFLCLFALKVAEVTLKRKLYRINMDFSVKNSQRKIFFSSLSIYIANKI